MNIELRKKLEKDQITLSKKNKEIASFLLKKNPSLNKIKDFKDKLGVAPSTTHKFITAIGYPSFKHFIYDYNNKYVGRHDGQYNDLKAKANEIAQIIGNKKIKIMTSVRAKSIGKLLHERLNDAKIPNQYFSATSMDRNKFIDKSINDVILVIDVSGESNSTHKTLSYYRTLKQKPLMVLLAASHPSIPFDIENYYALEDIFGKKYATNSWEDYNDSLLKLFEFVHFIMKSLYQNKRHN